MKPILMFVAAGLMLAQDSSTLAGRWEAVFAGPNTPDPYWPKPLHSTIPTRFDLQIYGNKIVGSVTVDYWPGLSDIRTSGVNGDKFWLTLQGREPACSGPPGNQVCSLPQMRIEGLWRGDDIEYTLIWGDFKAPMKGKRQPQ